jgi:hypothetical protein
MLAASSAAPHRIGPARSNPSSRGRNDETFPGPSLVVITLGSVPVYDASDSGCAPHVYTAGSADNSFVEIGGGDVHIVRNETDDVAVGYAVQFVPAHAVRRITEPQPANRSVS